VGSFPKEARFRSVLTLRRERSGALVAEHTKSTFGPALPARRVQDAWTTDDRGRLVAGYTVPAAPAPPAPPPAPTVTPPPPQPQPAPLPAPAGRAALRLVPSSSSSPALRGGEDDEKPDGGLSGHERIDAAVLEAARAHRGRAVPRALVARAAGYTVGVAASSLSRLKKRGLVENVGRGEWRATPAGEEAGA
jgi:hypothetical protein